MADVVWSVLVSLPNASRDQIDDLLAMAGLWAGHLQGPGEHEGPVVLLSNLEDVGIDGVSVIRIESRARARRELFRECPSLAYRYMKPSPGDRYMQVDLDSLARHPIAPLFDGIRRGEMRVAPSMLPLTHPQQLGSILSRWQRLWYGYVRGWNQHLGVSASHTACAGSDWPDFMGRWASVAEIHSEGPSASEFPDEQGFLNYLYAIEGLPMRRFGPEEIHHLRLPDPTPAEEIDRARILHFPVPRKLERMREWSRL